MKILFDYYGEQIQAQLSSNTRLTGFFAAIQDAGWEYDIAPEGAVTAATLEGYDVFVLTTRMIQAWSPDELDAVYAFVQQSGKGLWAMANHAPFNSSQLYNNHVRYPSAIASTFFSSFQAAAYSSNTSISEVSLTGSNLGTHEIITGNNNWPLYGKNNSSEISEIVTRSFSALYPNSFGEMVAGLENLPNVVNFQDQAAITSGVWWSLAIDGGNPALKGRVVIGADAGWLADTTSTKPGKGEYQNGDNPQFSLNVLSWLGKL